MALAARDYVYLCTAQAFFSTSSHLWNILTPENFLNLPFGQYFPNTLYLLDIKNYLGFIKNQLGTLKNYLGSRKNYLEDIKNNLGPYQKLIVH